MFFISIMNVTLLYKFEICGDGINTTNWLLRRTNDDDIPMMHALLAKEYSIKDTVLSDVTDNTVSISFPIAVVPDTSYPVEYEMSLDHIISTYSYMPLCEWNKSHFITYYLVSCTATLDPDNLPVMSSE